MHILDKMKKIWLSALVLTGVLSSEVVFGSGFAASASLEQRVQEKDIKCSVFNGMDLVDPDMSRINIALDMGSGKLSFQVRDPITRYFMSYDPPKAGEPLNEIDAQIQSYIAALKNVAQRYADPKYTEDKDAGLKYKLDKIAVDDAAKQDFMNALMVGLQRVSGDQFPFVIATGAWRIARIDPSRISIPHHSRIRVLSAADEVVLTAASLELNPVKTDLTLTGASGIAASTSTFKEANSKMPDKFRNTKQIVELVDRIMDSAVADKIGDATLLGVLLENISRSVQFSKNEGHRRRRHFGPERSECSHPFSCPIHLHSGTSSTLLAAKTPEMSELLRRRGHEAIPLTRLVAAVEDHEQASLPDGVVQSIFKAAGITEERGINDCFKSDIAPAQKKIYRNIAMMLTSVLTKMHNEEDFRGTEPEAVARYKENLTRIASERFGVNASSLSHIREIPRALEHEFRESIERIQTANPPHGLSIQILRSFKYDPAFLGHRAPSPTAARGRH